jgi:UDP-3-O-[3-hydroxymyristoyl] glucosamine N-acyltransferase
VQSVLMRLGAIAESLGGELLGDPDAIVRRLAPLESAAADEIAFLSHTRYLNLLRHSQAGCVIVGPEHREEAVSRGHCIVTAQPYLYYARLTQLWRHMLAMKIPVRARIHATAVIDPAAQIHPTAKIGALCVVESGASVGAGTELKARVMLGENCSVGDRCILHSGVVVGADGFGFAPNGGAWEKIEQLGGVRIGNDVEIGANTCIDRGALEDTVIEDGVKLDNLIQIGHNVRIGRHTAMAGCVGVAGSAHIGAHCTVGGGAVVLGR